MAETEVPSPDRRADGGRATAERRVVHLFGGPGDFASLADALGGVGCDVVEGVSVQRLMETVCTGRHLAIVSDRYPNALDACALISKLCPTIFLTSRRDFEISLAAARAGAAAMVSWPLDPIEIMDWIDDLVGEPSAARLSVLIVDDDEILAETCALALGAAGVDTRILNDPRLALEALTAQPPDLVLLDMQMPHVSGLELARVIRQSRKFLSLPIIFLSAERDPRRQHEARRLGGDYFIPKPVDLRQLVDLVLMRAERAVALKALVERDSLTGLLNHARFSERVSAELARCRRDGSELSLAVIDIDRFKTINDGYGHACGDRVIKGLARALLNGVRRSDVIGRLGGEEFGVLMIGAAPDAAAQVVDRLRQQFSQLDFQSSGRSFRATFSAGVAGSRIRREPEELLHAADAALYRAKAGGRNLTLLDDDTRFEAERTPAVKIPA